MLEDQDEDAERRRDRQQVHEDRLERQQERPEGEEQQHVDDGQHQPMTRGRLSDDQRVAGEALGRLAADLTVARVCGAGRRRLGRPSRSRRLWSAGRPVATTSRTSLPAVVGDVVADRALDVRGQPVSAAVATPPGSGGETAFSAGTAESTRSTDGRSPGGCSSRTTRPTPPACPAARRGDDRVDGEVEPAPNCACIWSKPCRIGEDLGTIRASGVNVVSLRRQRDTSMGPARRRGRRTGPHDRSGDAVPAARLQARCRTRCARRRGPRRCGPR